MDFDRRAVILEQEIKESWDPPVRTSMKANQEAIRTGLIEQYGRQDVEQKIANFVELGGSPISVIAFHNDFFQQARNAFVVGAYYPSLTAACALGERVLNHLVLALRDDFQGTPHYKRVYRKESFEDWDLAIDTLASWKVLLPETVGLFRKLKSARHRAIHFRPDTDHNARALAVDAMKLLHGIVDTQFTAFGDRPWYFIHAGMSFVRRGFEKAPFVRRIILPSCVHVGPAHRLEGNGQPFRVVDATYREVEIDDDEYVRLFNEANGTTPVST
jgi:hypothetical protein